LQDPGPRGGGSQRRLGLHRPHSGHRSPHTALLNSALKASLSGTLHELATKLNVSMTKASTSGQLHWQPSVSRMPRMLSPGLVMASRNQSSRRTRAGSLGGAPDGMARKAAGNSLMIALSSLSSEARLARVQVGVVMPDGAGSAAVSKTTCWISCVSIWSVLTRQSSRDSPPTVADEVVLKASASWFNWPCTKTQGLVAPVIG